MILKSPYILIFVLCLLSNFVQAQERDTTEYLLAVVQLVNYRYTGYADGSNTYTFKINEFLLGQSNDLLIESQAIPMHGSGYFLRNMVNDDTIDEDELVIKYTIPKKPSFGEGEAHIVWV